MLETLRGLRSRFFPLGHGRAGNFSQIQDVTTEKAGVWRPWRNSRWAHWLGAFRLTSSPGLAWNPGWWTWTAELLQGPRVTCTCTDAVEALLHASGPSRSGCAAKGLNPCSTAVGAKARAAEDQALTGEAGTRQGGRTSRWACPEGASLAWPPHVAGSGPLLVEGTFGGVRDDRQDVRCDTCQDGGPL
ncbi:hypothetical protein KFL_002580205, partial [Klebsormidium nitens]